MFWKQHRHVERVVGCDFLQMPARVGKFTQQLRSQNLHNVRDFENCELMWMASKHKGDVWAILWYRLQGGAAGVGEVREM